MQRKMYNLEYRHVLAQAQALMQRHLGKIYQVPGQLLRLDFGRDSLIVSPGNYFYITQNPPKPPTNPSSFPMFLRKHIGGKRPSSFTQYHSDRIFIMEFGTGKKLVFEMFAQGCVSLLDDSNRLIHSFSFAHSKSKKHARGEEYTFPPASKFPQIPSRKEWESLPGEKKLSSSLSRWPIGKIYCLEALKLAKISPERTPSDLDDSQADNFLRTLSYIIKNPKPTVYIGDGNKPAQVSLFPLSDYENEKYTSKTFPTFSEALEFFLSSSQNAKAKEEPEGLKRLKIRLQEQKKALEKTEKQIEKLKEQADYVSANLHKIDEALILEKSKGKSKLTLKLQSESQKQP